MPDPENPLTEDDFDSIERALQLADQTEKGINKAIRAGVAVEGMLDDVRSQRQKLNQLKQTYFPGR